MQIYPAIDLKGGQCVRLYQGHFDQATHYDDEPIRVAANFSKQGASWLHVVDLDAAKDPLQNQAHIIADIVTNSQMSVQTGGGIREKKQVQTLLDAGVKRVVIGSLATKEPNLVKSWLDFFGKERIALAFDIKIMDEKAYIATHGWQQLSQHQLTELLDYYQKDLAHVLCTDISRDGTLSGPNLKLYQQLVQDYSYIEWQASGGVAELNDLSQLRQCGVAGTIVGKALYEKRFSLQDALSC